MQIQMNGTIVQKELYQYDENNNEIEDLWIKWDIENETWYNYLKIVKFSTMIY